jgi:hypothetical protein
MRFALPAAAGVALVAICAPANALTFEFYSEGNGEVDVFSPDPDLAFAIYGSDAPAFDNPPALTVYFAPNDGPQPLKIAGIFDYVSYDEGGPYFDPFGYYVGDRIFQLTDDDGPYFQSGTFGFIVAPGVDFGWFIHATDDAGGFAAAAVGASIMPVPLPSSVPLLIGGFLVLAGLSGRSGSLAFPEGSRSR